VVIRTYPQGAPDDWESDTVGRSRTDPPRRPLSAVVLAAGHGTRMRSDRPKPLHRLCGRPMILHVLDALAELPIDRVVVVVGHRAEWVTKDTGRRARLYELTSAGNERLGAEESRWAVVTAAVNRVLRTA